MEGDASPVFRGAIVSLYQNYNVCILCDINRKNANFSFYKLHLGEEDIKKKRSLHVSIYYIITNNSCIIARKNCTISTLSII